MLKTLRRHPLLVGMAEVLVDARPLRRHRAGRAPVPGAGGEARGPGELMGPLGSHRIEHGQLRRCGGDRARLAGGAQARPAADGLAVVRSLPGPFAAGFLRARALAHPAHAVPQGDHGLLVAVVAGAARGVHEGQSDRRNGGWQLLDWLRDSPGAGADDGGGADGGAGQAQLQAADRSADRGERGRSGRGSRSGAPETAATPCSARTSRVGC